MWGRGFSPGLPLPSFFFASLCAYCGESESLELALLCCCCCGCVGVCASPLPPASRWRLSARRLKSSSSVSSSSTSSTERRRVMMDRAALPPRVTVPRDSSLPAVLL